MKSDMTDIPEGWVGLNISGVYVNPSTNQLVVIGEPKEEDGHDCDAMGCSTFYHTLIRCEIPNWQAAQHGVKPTVPNVPPLRMFCGHDTDNIVP